MLTTLLRVAVGLLIVYGLIVILAWRYQERLAFPAPRQMLPAPAARGLEGERVAVTTSDGVKLYGWYLPPVDTAAGGAPGLLWFYGNMETVAGLAPMLDTLKPAEFGLLILDYRGYGESEGEPTEAGLYHDGEAAWGWLAARPEIDSTRIAVFGRSLGSAVGLHLATRHEVAAVVLDSPFASAAAMAREHYWFLPRFLIRLSMDNVARARALDAPLLVFHGTEDRVAPIAMGRAVAEAGKAREFVVLEGAGHNETLEAGGTRYRETMHAFLRRAVE